MLQIKPTAMSKSRKKAYTKAKAIDRSCRNHGSCPYCQGNRKYTNAKRLAESQTNE